MSQFPASPSNQQPTGSTQLVLIAGVVALVAVILMNVYVEMRAAADAEATETFFRLKVAKDRGDMLQAKDVELVDIPQSQVRGFGKDALRESQVSVGQPAGGWDRTFVVAADTGEILRDGMFLRDTSNRIGDNLEEGRRLITLRVSRENQPPNLLPEDRVDILANISRRSGLQSILVMEEAEVRLVGNRVARSGGEGGGSRSASYDNITIEVDRDLVTVLNDIQARIAGNEFQIVVRGRGDFMTTLPVERGEINPELLDMLGLD